MTSLMIAHLSEAGLSIYNPSTLSGVVKMLSGVLRQFGFETAEAQASVQLKCDFPGTGGAKFWYFESIDGCEEDTRRLLTAAVFASSYEQAVTLLYVTYCWE